MKTQMHTSLVVRSGLALAIALAVWSPVPLQSAEPAGKTMMTEGQMAERCQTMKEQKEKMMAEMKAQDAELTAQVAKMNSAPENQKLVLIAALVTRLVEQRTAMNARMEKMHEEMMQHMMQHMQMGKESMSQCPMMSGMDTKSEDAAEKRR